MLMQTSLQKMNKISTLSLMAKLISCFILLFVVNQSKAEPFNVIIHSEQWDMPRHGEALLKQPELGKMVRLWASQPGSVIEILYPGGEEGELWVRELMDWLIALGVPSEAIQSSPGSGDKDTINLILNRKQVKRNNVNE